MRALPASGYRGANVTIPHKLAAHDLADERSPAAAAIGAANTLIFEPAARIFGRQHRRRRADRRAGRADVRGRRRSCSAPAAPAVRRPGRCARPAPRSRSGTARPRGRSSWPREFGVRAVDAPEPASPGERHQRRAWSGGRARPSCRWRRPRSWSTWSTAARPTPLERWALARGARVVDGLEMLVRQGARSFELWTGRRRRWTPCARATTCV